MKSLIFVITLSYLTFPFAEEIENRLTNKDSVIVYVSENKESEKKYRYDFQVVNNSIYSLGTIYIGYSPDSNYAQFGNLLNYGDGKGPKGWGCAIRMRQADEKDFIRFYPEYRTFINFPIKPGDTLSGFSVFVKDQDSTFMDCIFSIYTLFDIKKSQIGRIDGKVTFLSN